MQAWPIGFVIISNGCLTNEQAHCAFHDVTIATADQVCQKAAIKQRKRARNKQLQTNSGQHQPTTDESITIDLLFPNLWRIN